VLSFSSCCRLACIGKQLTAQLWLLSLVPAMKKKRHEISAGNTKNSLSHSNGGEAERRREAGM